MGILDSVIKVALVTTAVATGVAWFAAPGLIAGGAAFAGLTAGSIAAFAARTFVTQFVLGALAAATAKTPDETSLSVGQQGRTITTRQALAAHRVIYGHTRIGGNIVYMEATDSNKYLHMVIALAGHEIDALEKVYFNDEEVTWDAGTGIVNSANYSGVAKIQYKLGTDDQTAFADLVSASDSKWTSNHRLRGIACLYVRLEYNQDKYPNGIPNVTALVRGKKVYDPRSDTTAYSSNPALCLADYLTNTKHGLGSDFGSEIDSTILIASANICDVDVSLTAGGTENRYEVNGYFDTSASPENIISQLLSAMAGKLVYSGGKWRIIAGSYYTPTLTFDEDDLREGFKVQTLVSRRELFNSVKGTFASSDDNYISADFPSVSSSTYVTQDGGEEIYTDIQLPFTTSPSMAQRLAKIQLERARQQITLGLPLKLVGMKANVGDVINITNAHLGWSAKPFEIVNATMNFSGEVFGVDLELRETASTVYDWSTEEEQAFDPAPNTTLPNPFEVGTPTDLTLNTINTVAPDGTTQSGIIATWTPPANSFVIQYEVQYIRGASNFDYGSITNSATETLNYGSITVEPDTFADYGSITDSTTSGEVEYNSVIVTTPYYVIPNAIAGVPYAVRVRAINALGVRSSFATSSETTYGDTTPPNVPSQIVATGGYKEITLTWLNPTVADFDFVEVYRNTTNNAGTSTRVGVLRGSKFVDTGLGINVLRYYWLKSVDRSGNKSDFSSPVSATTEFIDSDSFSSEVLNLFAEAGAYGIEPVATLPATGDFDGQIKYDTTNNKLWRWDATGSVWSDDIFSITSGSVDLASFASGIEPVGIVNELPNPSGYTGATIVFLTTDNKMYRYTGSAWTSSVLAADITGTLSSDNFSQNLRPVEVVSALPSSGNFQGRTVVLTTDNKLYRYTGSSWTASVPTSDLSGTITSAQIASVAAASVTGTLTDAQIADLSTAKLTGTITGTQITDGAISTAKLAANSVSTAKLAAGAVTADTIASNAVTAVKIQAGAVETAKIAAGAIDAGKIAADAITAEKIAAGAVETDAIAANAITTGKLAAGAVTADILAANSITAGKIAAGAVSATALAANAVTADKIQAGAIQTDKIAANAITGGLIAASGVITSAAQINDAVITNAKIQNGAITTAKIQDAQITTAKIGDLQVNTAKIADESVSVISTYEQDATNSTSFYSTFVYSMPNPGNATFILSIFPLGSFTTSSTMSNSFRENNPFGTPFEMLTTSSYLAGSPKTYSWTISHDTTVSGVQTSCQTVTTNVGLNSLSQRGALMRWMLIRTYK